ncbi:hypothetical protein P9112_003131 [Eukaryota sp. TZLM1-RC]
MTKSINAKTPNRGKSTIDPKQLMSQTPNQLHLSPLPVTSGSSLKEHADQIKTIVNNAIDSYFESISGQIHLDQPEKPTLDSHMTDSSSTMEEDTKETPSSPIAVPQDFPVMEEAVSAELAEETDSESSQAEEVAPGDETDPTTESEPSDADTLESESAESDMEGVTKTNIQLIDAVLGSPAPRIPAPVNLVDEDEDDSTSSGEEEQTLLEKEDDSDSSALSDASLDVSKAESDDLQSSDDSSSEESADDSVGVTQNQDVSSELSTDSDSQYDSESESESDVEAGKKRRVVEESSTKRFAPHAKKFHNDKEQPFVKRGGRGGQRGTRGRGSGRGERGRGRGRGDRGRGRGRGRN